MKPWNRHATLACVVERAIARKASLSWMIADEQRKAEPSRCILEQYRRELSRESLRESRALYDQRLLALPFAERRAAVGAPFVALYEEAGR